MFDKATWLATVEWALPFIPPSLFGAWLGLRWAKEQTPRQRAGSFASSSILSVYLTASVAEISKTGGFPLGPATLAIIAILGAVVGMDIIGGFVVIARQWKVDPNSTFGKWFSMLWPWAGRGQSPAPPPIAQPGDQPPGGGDPMRRGGP